MEELVKHQLTWGQFLGLGIMILLSYIVLFFLKELVDRLPVPRNIKTKAHGVFHNILVIYEPLAFLVLLIAFIFINPLFHGLLIFLLILINFTYLKIYMSGRLLMLNEHIEEGTILRLKNGEGLVTHMGRMGLDLQTNEGLHRVSYDSILREGYVLVASDEIGGFYQLRVSSKTASKVNHTTHLADLLATTPYIDWGHKPDILPLDDNNSEIEIRVLIKEESHLHDLIALIKEWGYSCQLVV